MADSGVIKEILVVDYVTDYLGLTDAQKDVIKDGLTGEYLLENCPNGTIIGIPIERTSSQQKRIYFPFFSHISMPIKPGEKAWAFDQGSGMASYWITRKVQNDAAEDLNFTQDDRAILYANLEGEQQRSLKSTIHLFDAGISGAVLSTLRKNAVSKDEIIGEPVAKIKSKSPDMSFQGSNDTAILMSHQYSVGTGTIDIIAGLGSTKSIADTSSLVTINTDGYKEIIKPIEGSDSISRSAGTLSTGDLSRITVSKSFNSDSYYGLTGDDSGSIPTICVKSDAIRIVANQDLKIAVGKSGTESYIIVKNDGNIIITPGNQIKLSGDSDDQAYLRYDQFNQIVQKLLDICAALQSSLGPSATAGIAASVATTAAGNPPGTPTGDAAVDAAVAAVNAERFADIGLSAADIMSLLETIKSTKILGS